MTKNTLRNQQGFTLVEIIAVLVLLGILAAVAIPKYMNMTDTAREKAAQGQIAEVKGRLNSALASYMLNNAGNKPANGADLITHINTMDATACPANDLTADGDFNFKCTGAAGTTQEVTITVTKISGTALTTAQDGKFTFK